MKSIKSSNSLLKSTLKSKSAIAIYIIVGLFLVLSVITNISIINEIKDYNSIKSITVESAFSNDYIKSQAYVCERKLASSDVIVTAVFNGNRQSGHYATLSDMTVTKVIKGDESLTGETISVWENNALSASKGKLYMRNFTPVNLFEDSKEYLLFLDDFQDYDDEYASYKNIQNNVYVMTDYFASSFCIQDTQTKILSADCNENTVEYSDFKSNEFIVFSQEQKDTMYDLKSSVIDTYLS